MIYKILDEIAKTSATNSKVAILKAHSNNELLKRAVSMALDKVTFSYGIRKFPAVSPATKPTMSLPEALDFLEFQLATRNITGNSAISELCNVLSKLSQEDFLVIQRVLGRDLKCGIGKTQANRVWSNLIIKPPYMRAKIYSDDTIKRISFPCFSQEKMDGLYVAIQKDGESISLSTRSGEELNLPKVAARFSELPDSVYIGELLVTGYEQNRAAGNGLINSSNPPEELIYVTLWDCVSNPGYANGSSIPYKQRYDLLCKITAGTQIKLVDTKIVNNIKEALEHASSIMGLGGEGTIIKDFKLNFQNHTSPLMLKVKLKIELDVRITGFISGNAGSKNENYFSAISYTTDDGKIEGQVGVTSMSEDTRDALHSIKDSLIGKVMAIEGNTLTIARDSAIYSVQHPRFIEIRCDKDTTDDLSRALEVVNGAKSLI